MSRRLNRAEPPGLLGEASKVINTLLNAAFSPTKRDKQVSIGPSGVGDPCDYCVASLMAGRLTGAPPLDRGSLATWIGTAIHERLAVLLAGENAPPELARLELQAEQRILCGHINGYGDIYGTGDLYTTAAGGGVIDWKGSKKDKIKYYKLHGTPTTYGYQRDIYGKGFVDNGFPVKWVANVFIPRDGFYFSDCWTDVQLFSYQNAIDALQRAETIWNDFVIPGKMEELASDEDCWECNMSSYVKMNQEGVVIINNGEG